MVSTEVLNAFYTTTVVVFAQEVNEELHRTDLKLAPVDRTTEELAAIIAVTGELEGIVVLEMNRMTAKRIACGMAGFDIPAYDPMVESAIGELANIVVGRATGELEALELACDIAPPAIVSGKGVEVSPFGIPAVTAVLAGKVGHVTLRIALRRRGGS
jgi:chemotaxis protein CheX